MLESNCAAAIECSSRSLEQERDCDVKNKSSLFRNAPSVAALALMLVLSLTFAQSPPINAQTLQPRGQTLAAKLSDTTQPSPAGATSDSGILRALQEQLGLKLEGHRDQVEVIVIDSVERPVQE